MQSRSRIMLWVSAGLASVSPFLVLAATQDRADSTTAVRLPEPQARGGMALTEALATRRSHRSFESRPVTPEQISQLCWAAMGITDVDGGFRTAPSALKLFAIRAFVVDRSGAYEYIPGSHALRRLDLAEADSKLRAVIAPTLKSAPLYVVLAMEPDRLKERCGDRAERYSLLEAGHVAQNVLLQATALGLVGVPAGGIDEAKTAQALNLPQGLRPVYVIPLGYAAK